VGAGEHRGVRELVCKRSHAGDDPVERRQHHLVARALHHERVTHVVDVFGRAREMNEFRDARDFLVIPEALLQKVLDGFHVMVGACFDFLHAPAVGFAEARDDVVEPREGCRGKRGNLAKRGFGRERPQPFDFDERAKADERVLAEKCPQGSDLRGVTSVERGKRGERREWHGEPAILTSLQF
jgi:hypothetical protein